MSRFLKQFLILLPPNHHPILWIMSVCLQYRIWNLSCDLDKVFHITKYPRACSLQKFDYTNLEIPTQAHGNVSFVNCVVEKYRVKFWYLDYELQICTEYPVLHIIFHTIENFILYWSFRNLIRASTRLTPSLNKFSFNSIRQRAYHRKWSE